ncbi:head GIN domain-containing protein [Muriicola sp.]|uniref:head GIN domain-containing protein n=1 Tax=Muriicola sp. TaxID=2020856 RepID=UPI003C70B27C
MKKLLLFAFVLVAVNSFAQHIVDKEVGDFNEIKVFDLIEVNLIKADENRILIKGDHVDDIQFVNKDGVLKLKMQLEKKFQGEDTLIEVYYTDIDIIDGNEGAQIVCNETVARDAITVKVQEGAQVKIGMDVVQLDARAVTGGIIEAAGVAKNQVIVVNTGGIFMGRDLKTAYSSVKVLAGGEATLSASEKVDINVRAGGDVIVYGNPKEVNKNTLVGGRIYIKD